MWVALNIVQLRVLYLIKIGCYSKDINKNMPEKNARVACVPPV
jgi:hypothetical protein